MVPSEDIAFAHVIATVDVVAGTGSIRYVLPSHKRTGSVPAEAGASRGYEVDLVLKRQDGSEIARVRPELRFEACTDGEEPRMAMIQQDIPVGEGLAEIDLEFDGRTLDAFRPEPPAEELGADSLSLGPPSPGHANRMALGAANVSRRPGVSYMVQAKPNTSEHWQTLAVGRPTPEFEIDKNQFPGAVKLEVRVVQERGFDRRTIDERTVELE